MKTRRRVEHVSTRTRVEKLGIKQGTDVLLLGMTAMPASPPPGRNAHPRG